MGYQLVEKQLLVNEHKIFYLQGGTLTASSIPILFIHGWGVAIKPYQEALNTLSQHHQVIAPVLPGFGKSSNSQSHWNYYDYAQVIKAFIKQLNIPKVHLIGHSLGGGIAATIAADMPNIIESLILVDSTGIPVEPVFKVFLKRLVEMSAQSPQIQFPQIVQIFQAFAYNLLFRTKTTFQALWLSLTQDLSQSLSKISSPCLLIWGANDLTTPINAGKGFNRQINGSKLVIVDNVYHEWSIFFVEKFTNIVSTFICEIENRNNERMV